MKKLNAQVELVKLDLPVIMEKMYQYAKSLLRYIDIKKMEGLQPMDFVQQVMCKTCEGVIDWENANTNKMEAFLMYNLKSECVNFIRKLNRRNAEMNCYNEINTIEKGILFTP